MPYDDMYQQVYNGVWDNGWGNTIREAEERGRQAENNVSLFRYWLEDMKEGPMAAEEALKLAIVAQAALEVYWRAEDALGTHLWRMLEAKVEETLKEEKP